MLTQKSKRLSVLDLYMFIICLFPVVTVIVKEGMINKLLFALMFGLHVILMLLKPVKQKTFILLLVLAVNYIFALISTDFPLENVNLLFYFPFFVLYTCFVCDNRERVIDWLKNNKSLINMIMLIWSVVVGISFFVPQCYNVQEGGNLYFGSFCGTIFRLGPAAVFIQILAIVLQLFHRQKSAILYMIIPVCSFFMGSSRTYLVVGLCLFAVAWYFTCKNRTVFWATVLPLSLVAIVLMAQTAIGDKIEYTLDEEQYGDFWFRITSSRSMLWTMDLNAWSRDSLVCKLFGCGLDMTIQVSGVWGHNDFIEILCSFGILGLILYLYSVRLLYRKSYGRNRLPFVVKACVFIAWFFNAFFNMHYVYFCAMLSYPFLTLALGEYFEQDPMPEKRRNPLIWNKEMSL